MRVRVGQEITVLQSKSGRGSLWVKGEKALGVTVGHSEAHPEGALEVRDHSRSGDPGPHGDRSPRPCAPLCRPSILCPVHLTARLPRILFSLQQGLEHSEGLSPPWKGQGS